MSDARGFLFTALIVFLLVTVSCSRAPEEVPPSTPVSSSEVEGGGESRQAVDQGPERSASNRVSADAASAVSFAAVAIDLNSGDLKGSKDIVDGPPPHVIYESELSKEVRRLGISVPEERRWMPIAGSPRGGTEVYYIYEDLLPTAHRLLTLLDRVKATDAERRDVLERLMTSVRTEKSLVAIEMGYVLTVEVCDRHGVESPFIPEFTEPFRQVGRGRARQPNSAEISGAPALNSSPE